MADLDRAWAAVERMREAHADLAVFRRNVYLRRVEADEAHERHLAQQVEDAEREVDLIVAEFEGLRTAVKS